jgi:integrase
MPALADKDGVIGAFRLGWAMAEFRGRIRLGPHDPAAPPVGEAARTDDALPLSAERRPCEQAIETREVLASLAGQLDVDVPVGELSDQDHERDKKASERLGQLANLVHREWAEHPGGPDRAQDRTFTRYAEAERHLAKVAHGKWTGSYVDPSAGKAKFGVFAEGWLESQTFDASTRATVTSRLTNHILPTFGNLELRQIRPSTVQAWLKGRSDVLAAGTVKAALSTLNAILGAAIEDGMIARNPCAARSVTAPALERERVIPWTVEQLRAVIDAHPLEWRAVPIVGAGCGLRRGEIFGLQVDDVDFLHRRLLIRHQVKPGRVLGPPKGRKTREVPLPDVVAVAISEHLRNVPTSGHSVFHRDGELVHALTYSRGVWKPALVEAGVVPSPRNGLHILRHTYASMQLEAGTSIRALAEYLGHHDPGFTLRTYTHLMPESEDRARQAIDLLLGEPAATSWERARPTASV